MKAANTLHDGSKGSGNGRLRSIRVMKLAVQIVTVNGGLEGCFDLGGGGVKANPSTTARGGRQLESLRLEPFGHLIVIALRGAEAIRELFRSEPLVIAGRVWILLVRE